MLEGEKVAKTENLRSALCGISEFEENEKKCVCFLYNCLHFLQLYSFKYATFKPSYHNHTHCLLQEDIVCVPNSDDGLNVSKDGFLAIRSGITLSSIPSDWEPGTLLLFELFYLRSSDKRVDLKCWSFVPKENVTNDGVFGYNLIKKPVDIKALRKYLANKFSFRGLVPYHADGGIGMKASYEIV